MNVRNLAIWGVILIAVALIYSVMQGQTRGGAAPQDLAYSDLLAGGSVVTRILKQERAEGALAQHKEPEQGSQLIITGFQVVS